MTTFVFLDNTVLCNFAAVHRLDLLELMLRGRGRWTEAVAFEASRSARYLPDIDVKRMRSWLVDPIELIGEDDARLVEHLRRAVFGGTETNPLQHLGEAQTCYLLKEVPRWKGSIWASDDHDAVDFARANGIPTRATADLIDEGVAVSDLNSAEGRSLLKAISESRG